MEKDRRFTDVNIAYRKGLIRSFPDIFNYIPKTVVYKALGKKFEYFERRLKDPTLFTMGELMEIARLFDLPEDTFYNLVARDVVRSKKGRSPRN